VALEEASYYLPRSIVKSGSPILSSFFLFILLQFSGIYVHQVDFQNPTPVSRLNLLRAIVHDGTIHINKYADNTTNKAVHNGNYYSDKAPGIVALGLVPYALSMWILKSCGQSVDSEFAWLIGSWATCACSICVLMSLGGVAMYWLLLRYVSPVPALVTTIGMHLGCLSLPYCTLLYSHAATMGVLSIALWALHRHKERLGSRCHAISRFDGLNQYGWLAIVGHCCGWAIACEFTAGLVSVGIVGMALFTDRRWKMLRVSSLRRFLRWQTNRVKIIGWITTLVLGALLPLSLIPIYNYLCFQQFFTLPYSFQETFPAMQTGFFSIQFANAETAYNLLFSKSRGLFIVSPMLWLLPMGYVLLFKRNTRLFWFTYLLPLIHLVVLSGRVWDWSAGPSWGPRYLAPMVPCLAIPLALMVQKHLKISMVFIIASVGLTTMGVLTNACIPVDFFESNLLSHIINNLSSGNVSHNLGAMLRFDRVVAMTLYYGVLIILGCLAVASAHREKKLRHL